MKKLLVYSFVFLLVCLKAFTQQITDFEWKVSLADNSNVIITGYTGTDRSIVIPETINGMSVIYLAERAFAGKELISVTIPPSVRGIGEEAFVANKLENIIVPGSVEIIEDAAFQGNRLSSITIHEGVKAINDAAFSHNQLTRIVIPSSVTFIGDIAFQLNSLISITIGENVILGIHSGILDLYDDSFNLAYVSNGRLAGTYTRPNVNSTVWTRK
jgi:hypothetical protein